MRTLDATCFPLSGHRLIEASAGTGKTYTITNLYLRLLLGHSEALARPLAVNEILVLTFTIAATEELRQRIRDRIFVARQCLAAEDAGHDVFLQFLLDSSTDPARDTRLLTAALHLLDEAAIFTIHGVCAQILKEQAFATGTLFDQQLDADADQLLQMAAEDCFRAELLTLPPLQRDIALNLWPTPAALLQRTRGFIGRHNLAMRPEARNIDAQLSQLQAAVQQVRHLWFSSDFPALVRASGVRANSTSITRLAAMSEFLQGDGVFSEHWQYFSTAGLQANLKKAGAAPDHAIMALLDDITAAQYLADQVQYNLWHRVMQSLRNNLAQYKITQNQLVLDDLLINVHKALHQGAMGEALAQQLASQWPVAMIDEFQDTDDIQYGIFSKIYHRPGPQSLLLIGDPKQAIYQFRGADIYTYINAKRQVDPQQDMFSLGVNWRSTAGLVTAVNTLFHQPDVFANDQDIPFSPVSPYPGADQTQLLVDGLAATPVTFFTLTQADGTGLTRADASSLAMHYAAEQTARLLHGNATLAGKPVQAGQIAFLVRRHSDMKFARAALAARHIRSVYVTQESVFSSDTADDLALVLQAVIEPGNEAALRTALATRLLQATVSEIAGLNQTAQQHHALLEEFRAYHERWTKLGVAAMLDAMTRRRQLARKWFRQLDGERQITNLRHLAELLQARASIAPGMHRLLKWFNRERQAAANNANEERQLRLESDQSLVQIVTIHAAKGLEYDIVMIPLAAFGADARGGKPPVLLHEVTADASFATILDLRDIDAVKQQARQENLTEEMRLLYVAITRARYCCYLGYPLYGSRSRNGQTSLGKLLGVDPQCADASSLVQQVQALPENLFALVQVTEVPVSPVTSQAPNQPLTPPPAAPSVFDPWRVHSYTGLSHLILRRELDASATDAPAGYLDDDPGEDPSVLSAASRRGNEGRSSFDQFSFPRGRRIGIGLHTLLEHLDFGAGPEQRALAVARCVSRLGLAQDKAELETALALWLEHILQTPLGHHTLFRLAAIPRQDCLNELEFHFPVNTGQALVDTLKAANYLAPDATLALHQISGMLTGLIDLVVRVEGRYYLLDYKSNHLGDTAADYAPAALAQAIRQHQYDLQYLLYTVALHRYLRQRLPGYAYESHFGGVCYLFLRGMDKTKANSGVFLDQPAAKLIDQLDRVLGGHV